MSKIYNIDNLSDRYKDNNFKEREAIAFEVKFPEARIIRENYKNERDLENDWQKYCELPYHLKVLCNERCLRLYGCKNEEQYMRLKSKFMKQNIDRDDLVKDKYIPMGFKESVEDEFLIKQAKDYMNSGGHSILLINYDNLADLNTDWYNFNNQCYDYKVKANNKSLEIYGKTVPEVYQKEVHKFLQKDIKNSSLDDLSIKHVVSDSLSANEAVFESIETDLDQARCIMLLEMAKNQINSPVEQSLYEYELQKTTDWIQCTNLMQENYLGRYNYLLPWEIMGLFESSEALMKNDLFLNYYCRAIGFKPPMDNFQETVHNMLLTETNPNNLLLIGWNSVLDPKQQSHQLISSMRSNQILKEYCKYWFLDLEHTPNLLTESEYNEPFHKGISILIVQELDKDNEKNVKEVPKVMVSFDYNNPSWSPLVYGKLSYTQNIDDIINNFKIPVVSNYFLGLGDQLFDKLRSIHIDEFNRANEIQKVCNALHTATPSIANKKLFINYLLSSLMHSNFGDNPFPLRFDYEQPKAVVIKLNSKLFGNSKDISESYSKLGLFREDGANIQETFIFKNSEYIINDIKKNESLNEITDFSSTPQFTEKWSDFVKLVNPYPNI